MAEDAKNDSVAENIDAKKGRALKKTQDKPKKSPKSESTKTSKATSEKSVAEKVTSNRTASGKTVSEKVTSETVTSEDGARDDFQDEIRAQIENCKNELQIALEQSIEERFDITLRKQLKIANRQRRSAVILRDIVILLLAAVVGYFGWCLYDARYFGWMGTADCPECANSEPTTDAVEEVVKDTHWYINNYGYLFEDLQLGLSADEIEAYYLYSDDHKISDMKPSYLLGMAYNRVVPTTSSSENNTPSTIATSDLRTAFERLFGTTDYFEKTSFTHGCKKFTYVREDDQFVTENGDCSVESNRTVVEEIDEMYEEGNVLYILTTAAIYDAKDSSFYSFNNLFKPAVANTSKDDLAKNRTVLNRYQYQFKKTGEKYHFSGIVKLQ